MNCMLALSTASECKQCLQRELECGVKYRQREHTSVSKVMHFKPQYLYEYIYTANKYRLYMNLHHGATLVSILCI